MQVRALPCSDPTKQPPGFVPNPTLCGNFTSYYARELLLVMDFGLNCLKVGMCTEDPEHTEDWAVSKYSGYMCAGHNGKCCEDPGMGCLMWCCCANPCIFLRNIERTRLELRDGVMQYPKEADGSVKLDHCEAICLAACCGGCWLGNCVTPCYQARMLLRAHGKPRMVPCADVRSSAARCCCGKHRSSTWRRAASSCATATRSRAAPSMTSGALLHFVPGACVPVRSLTACARSDGGSMLSTWQEAYELGKRQGYEVPGTKTAATKAAE